MTPDLPGLNPFIDNNIIKATFNVLVEDKKQLERKSKANLGGLGNKD